MNKCVGEVIGLEIIIKTLKLCSKHFSSEENNVFENLRFKNKQARMGNGRNG